jgi:hypothetical protein
MEVCFEAGWYRRSCVSRGLENAYPRFDNGDEDRANERAARHLGIDGPSDVWTWENRLSIGCERGPSSISLCTHFGTQENDDLCARLRRMRPIHDLPAA